MQLFLPSYGFFKFSGVQYFGVKTFRAVFLNGVMPAHVGIFPMNCFHSKKYSTDLPENPMI